MPRYDPQLSSINFWVLVFTYRTFIFWNVIFPIASTELSLFPHNTASIKRKDFIVKTEKYSTNKPYGKREYLNNSETNNLIRTFYAYLDWKVRIPRIRHGNRQSLETLINEESLLFAKYLRNERETWIPRIAIPNLSY
jgi:hypothetical protein